MVEKEGSPEDVTNEEQNVSEPSEPHVDTLGTKLKALVRPLYVKIILSLALLLALMGGGFSTCSKPPPAMYKQHYTIGLDPSWYPLPLWSWEKI